MVHNFMLNLSTTAATLEEEICERVSKGVNSNLGGVGFGGWGFLVWFFVGCLVGFWGGFVFLLVWGFFFDDTEELK